MPDDNAAAMARGASHGSGGKDEARLTRGSIRGHLVAQTLPMIVGVGAIMSVGIVDAYFVGKLGADALAAIAFVFPVTMALSSLGVGVIAGTSSVVSRALGENDREKARDMGNLGVVVSAVFGIAIATLLYTLRVPLFRLLQADETLLPLIDAYMAPFALFFPLILVMMGISGVLRGQGAAKRAAAILLTYAISNWFLDPLLVTGAFGFAGLGIAGAAWATVIGWALGLIVAFVSLQSSAISFQPHRVRGDVVRHGTGALVRVAGPAAVSNSINPVGLAVLTALLAREGQDAVAGFGAGGRLESFAVVPLLGLSSSIGAIVGQNWGAGRIDRVRTALLWAGGFALVYGLAIAALLVLFRQPLAAMFSQDTAVRDALALYLVIAAWGYAGYGVQIVANGALNAIDRAGLALAQSAGRVALVMLPFAWLLRPSWGTRAIYGAELAANLAGGLVALFILFRVFRSEKAPRATASR